MNDKKRVILVDLEGTLSDKDQRSHLHPENGGDWDSWNMAFEDDDPLPLLEKIILLQREFGIVIATAKMNKYLPLIKDWLEHWVPELAILAILTRNDDDLRPSPAVKADMIFEAEKRGFDVAMAFDDRSDVCSMYRSKGILTFEVENKSETKKHKETRKHKEPHEILNNAGNIFKSRSKAYGKSYVNFGKVLLSLFPDGLKLQTEDDFRRWGVFTLMMSKTQRYSNNFKSGGHKDSLDDLIAYSAMLQELDSLI